MSIFSGTLGLDNLSVVPLLTRSALNEVRLRVNSATILALLDTDVVASINSEAYKYPGAFW